MFCMVVRDGVSKTKLDTLKLRLILLKLYSEVRTSQTAQKSLNLKFRTRFIPSLVKVHSMPILIPVFDIARYGTHLNFLIWKRLITHSTYALNRLMMSNCLVYANCFDKLKLINLKSQHCTARYLSSYKVREGGALLLIFLHS